MPATGQFEPEELAERVYLTPSGLSRMIDRMEERALVRRSTDAADQRANTVTLTPAGTALFRRAARSHRQRVRECFLQRMTPVQRCTLAEVWRILGE